MSVSRPPSIRELAAKLGVSRTTVSLALRNHPRISETTRRRVHDFAVSQGYQPNALVNALMSHLRRRRPVHANGEVMAFLTTGETENSWKKLPTIVDCFNGIRNQAEQQGFHLEPFWLGREGEAARSVARVLHARAVRGSLLCLIKDESGKLDLDWDHHPVIALGYTFNQKHLHQVAHNHFNGILSAYQELRKLGYQRIGLVLAHYDDNHVNHYWTAGFSVGQRLYGGTILKPLLLKDHNELDACQRWFERIRPDAIIGTHPDPALTMLEKQGVNVPNESAYVTLDLESSNFGRIAGIRQNWDGMGAAMVDLLIGQLHINHYGLPATPRIILIEGHWKTGATVHPA